MKFLFSDVKTKRKLVFMAMISAFSFSLVFSLDRWIGRNEISLFWNLYIYIGFMTAMILVSNLFKNANQFLRVIIISTLITLSATLGYIIPIGDFILLPVLAEYIINFNN